MNLHQTKRALWLAALMVAGCGILVMYWGATTPLNEKTYVRPHVEGKSSVKSVEAQELPSLAELKQVAGRNYRQRLFDPPPPPPPPPVKPKPKPMPPGKLVGTVVNGTNSSAMIEVGRGNVEFKKIGDRIGQESNYAVIKAIETNRIVLEHDGKEVDWIVEEQP